MQFISQFLPLILGLLFAGLCGGLIAGLLGVGGGIIMVPAMALAFQLLGYDAAIYQHVAVGTSLAIIIMTGSSSALAHYRRGAVMMDIIKLWAPFIILSSFLGGLSARLYSGDSLRIIFAIIALFVALNILLPIQEKLIGKLDQSNLTHRIIAFIVGYVSALMGIGGGSLSVPSLVAFGHNIHKAVGTGALIGVLIAIPATLGFIISGIGVAGRPFYSIGYVNLPSLFLIGLVASFFAPIGAKLAHNLEQNLLKRIFVIFLLIVALRMLYQALI